MSYKIHEYIFESSCNEGFGPIYVKIRENSLVFSQDDDDIHLEKIDIVKLMDLLTEINELKNAD